MVNNFFRANLEDFSRNIACALEIACIATARVGIGRTDLIDRDGKIWYYSLVEE